MLELGVGEADGVVNRTIIIIYRKPQLELEGLVIVKVEMDDDNTQTS